MGGSLLIGPCMKPRVAFVFLAFMDVVDQILWSITCNVNICGPLSVPVQTVPRVLFPHPWPRESALLILIIPTFLGVVAFNAYHALRNNHSLDIDKAVSSSDFCDLLLIACEVMQYFSGELMHTSR